MEIDGNPTASKWKIEFWAFHDLNSQYHFLTSWSSTEKSAQYWHTVERPNIHSPDLGSTNLFGNQGTVQKIAPNLLLETIAVISSSNRVENKQFEGHSIQFFISSSDFVDW